MMDAQTASLLQSIIRREGRSLLQYVNDLSPWTRECEQDRLAQLHALVNEERDGIAAVVRVLTRNRVMPPYLGAYPMGFTSLNFTSFQSLMPRLIDFQQRSLPILESDLVRLNEPEARGAVQSLVAMKRRHLKTLEAMGENSHA
jgi:hypothetical protein